MSMRFSKFIAICITLLGKQSPSMQPRRLSPLNRLITCAAKRPIFSGRSEALAQHCAAEKPDLSHIRKMIETEELSPNGKPMINAIRYGTPKTVGLLLAMGAQAYPHHFSSRGPVLDAVQLNKPEHVRTLRKHGVSFSRPVWNKHFMPSMTCAAKLVGVNLGAWAGLGFLHLFLAAMAHDDVHTTWQSILAWTAVPGIFTVPPAALLAFVSYQTQKRVGWPNKESLLHIASKAGHHEVITELLKGDADPHTRDLWRNKAIDVAKDSPTKTILEQAMRANR